VFECITPYCGGLASNGLVKQKPDAAAAVYTGS